MKGDPPKLSLRIVLVLPEDNWKGAREAADLPSFCKLLWATKQDKAALALSLPCVRQGVLFGFPPSPLRCVTHRPNYLSIGDIEH